MSTHHISAPAEQDLLGAAVAVAQRLQDGLAGVLGAASQSPRPSDLVRRFGLDKSIASRLSRSLRADSPYEFLHFVPSPAGLALVLASIERRSPSGEAMRQARARVQEFDDLLASFPGGRSALDALISHELLDVRQRAERTAMQSVFRAMSSLLGFQCDVVSSAIILQPSAVGEGVDGIDVSRREGIFRLRPSAPVSLFSVNLDVGPGEEAPHLELLHGGQAPDSAASLLLPEFCSPSDPPIELIQSGAHTVIALSEQGTQLHEPVTISTGYFVRKGWISHRTEGQHEDGRSYLLPYPCRLLVRDIFIRDDLYVGEEPQLRLEFPNPTGPTGPRMPGFPTRLNTLDLCAPVQNLGRGLGNAAVAGVPEHSRLLAHAFREAGWNPERFRGYRARVSYPVPMVVMGWWVPLPERPTSR